MPRAYIRVVPDLFDRKVLQQKYPPAAAMAFVGCLCLGESVSPRGRFRSIATLKAMLTGPNGEGAAYSRSVNYLIEHGDLVVNGDGSVYIDGWDELQEGRDNTVSDRVERYRKRVRNGAGNAPVTVGVTRNTETGNGPSRARPRRGSEVRGERLEVRGEPLTDSRADPEAEALSYLASVGATIQPTGNGFHRRLALLVERQGSDPVIAALRRATDEGAKSDRQHLFAAEGYLEPITEKRNGKTPGGHTRTTKEVDDAFLSEL